MDGRGWIWEYEVGSGVTKVAVHCAECVDMNLFISFSELGDEGTCVKTRQDETTERLAKTRANEGRDGTNLPYIQDQRKRFPPTRARPTCASFSVLGLSSPLAPVI